VSDISANVLAMFFHEYIVVTENFPHRLLPQLELKISWHSPNLPLRKMTHALGDPSAVRE
jgi:hypothetical protein